jgi:hypothetical protein
VTRLRRTAANAVVAPLLTLASVACGADTTSPTPRSGIPSPSAGSGVAITDLSAIGCATDDPAGVGELTGAWEGNDGGVYYIRQVGDCVWWFGTEVEDIDPGATGQRGFANVASGRIVGTQIDLEWADVPLGNKVNGGGLTYAYDEANDRLTLTEQRGGGEPFGGTLLTRFEPPASTAASPSPPASASP